MKNSILYYIAAGLTILALVYTVYTNTNLREENLGLTKQVQSCEDKIQKQYSIDSCLDTAYKNYVDEWVKFCKTNGIKVVNNNCDISVIYSNEFDKQYQTEKSLCIQRYK